MQIQGMAAKFIQSLQGSYSAVVGLPLYETATFIIRSRISRTTAVIRPKIDLDRNYLLISDKPGFRRIAS